MSANANELASKAGGAGVTIRTREQPGTEAPTPEVKPSILASVSGDVDGLTPTALYQLEKKIELEIECPAFGRVNPKTTYVFDMRPDDPAMKLIVFDHHPPYPTPNNWEIHTEGDHIPATLVVAHHLGIKEGNPHAWRIPIGLDGDGSAALTPTWIWKQFRELTELTGYPRDSYGKLALKPILAYEQAKSLLNFGCRLGAFKETYALYVGAESVEDIISSSYLLSCRRKVNMEMVRVVKEDLRMLDFPRIIYMEYNTPYKLWMGHRGYEYAHKTCIALNMQEKSGSIRGPLSPLVVEELQKVGIDAGGHPGFAGLSFKPEQVKTIKSVLRKI